MPPKPRKPPPRRPGTRNRNLLIAGAGAVAVVAVLVVVSLVVTGGSDNGSSSTTPGDATAALFNGIPQKNTVLGAQNATVTMIQFEDLQCPICRRFQEEGFPGVVSDYVRPGKVKLRFVGMAFIGADSQKALLYTLAAGEQGKLWQFSDALYANQGGENEGWVTDGLLERIAGDLGLDYAKLKADAASPVTRLRKQVPTVETTSRHAVSRAATRRVGDGVGTLSVSAAMALRYRHGR